ncbi:MAG: HAMP domain-containing protein [Nitratireductor sp.]|nr:HAMP domain-containing protein [Nitratireductor sp.]
MPRGLYARSILIIITPMVILQIVIAYVFMERHWQTVTQRLSTAVTADIASIIDIIETYPQDADYEEITRIARERLRLNIAILPPDPFPPPTAKPFFSILDDVLQEEVTRQIGRPFWIDTVGDSNLVEIRVRLEQPEKVLRVYARRSQAYASNSHIFLLWMVGASLFLIVVSILFLRNQIRPIQNLARAAELYGKGRDLPIDFHIRGAREVRQAGLAFLQMRERIDRQIQQRTAMLTGVSHDLRTILTRFKLQVALLGDSHETEELQRDIDEMQRMLQGYLDFAKGEAGEQIGVVRIADLFERHRNEASLKNCKYTVSSPKGLSIRGRPNALARMVGNIVTNAFRHASKVKATAVDDGQDIVLWVDDNGSGIPPGKREEVFKPFIRLDEARNQDESGTGLGLSIAKDIARLHGGDIKLEDSPMGGLRATVRLPH